MIQDDSSGAGLVAAPTLPTPSPNPPAPPPLTVVRTVGMGGNMDLIRLGDLIGGVVTEASSEYLAVERAGVTFPGIAGVFTVFASISGQGFTYTTGAVQQLAGGTVTHFSFVIESSAPYVNLLHFGTQVDNIPAPQFAFWIGNDATQAALDAILSGSQRYEGGPFADLMRGLAGDDLFRVRDNDTVFGGLGDDQIFSDATGAKSVAYLRGDEGNDYIIGGAGFDDINGNMGNDTCFGGAGNDWVVGGKDNDLLFGSIGNDLVYGNIGADTCEGGDGDDIVRGGQDNDVVRGGNGADFVSGDKGVDTMTGGAGADIFHTFGETDFDYVTDFNVDDRDRVQVDPGTQYTVTQVGADTVISMVGGGNMVLVGVNMSTLPVGWIFGA